MGKTEQLVRAATEPVWMVEGYRSVPPALPRPSDTHGTSRDKSAMLPDDRMHFPFGSDGEERP